ncbi:MAG TPA: metallophosphoesterase [Ignavibacteriaceae bacterium]|nr:metallophosphoesterase [Ignavibacteriaceae bacterium]
MILFFAVFFSLYGAINYYIFIRGWQALAYIPALRPFYIALFLLASLSYIAAKFLESYLPQFLYDLLLWIGSFWFAFMLYFFLFIVFIDLLRLMNLLLNFFPAFIISNYLQAKVITAAAILLLSSIVILFGYINTRNITVKTLEIILPKKQSSLNELNAVVASDFHLTSVNDGSLLEQIIGKINEINPDLILIPGDIVDDKFNILKNKRIGSSFLKLKPKYGIYASTGNHEYIAGIEDALKFMNEYKIGLLRDAGITVGDFFTIVSRDDRSSSQFTGKKRKELQEIMSTVDKKLPVILLDHTPFGLEEAEKNGIDLQLSGHTHHGQIFPLNLITKLIYEVSWGYLKKGNTQYYVTSGVGTWGPPVRLGSDTEIVKLKIKFK